MTRYQHILATTDLSDINRPAVKRAASLASLLDSRFTLLHVIEHFPCEEPLASVFHGDTRALDNLGQQARSRMEKLVAKMGLKDVQAEIRMTMRSARHEILRFAEKSEADLIVVAPHGRGLIQSLGSTAMGVLHGAACDVLVVREAAAE